MKKKCYYCRKLFNMEVIYFADRSLDKKRIKDKRFWRSDEIMFLKNGFGICYKCFRKMSDNYVYSKERKEERLNNHLKWEKSHK